MSGGKDDNKFSLGPCHDIHCPIGMRYLHSISNENAVPPILWEGGL